jgi:hypothetical protein
MTGKLCRGPIEGDEVMRNPRRADRWLRGAAVAALAALAAGAAHAAVVVLPDAGSYEYFGLNFAVNIVQSTKVGVLDYTGGPGCGGVCTAATVLGKDPSTSLQVDEVTFDNTSGGFAEAQLFYGVEYVNPTPGTYAVTLHASDGFSGFASDANARGQAYIAFGSPVSDPSDPHAFQTIDYQDTDCVHGCATGVANYTAPAPIPSNIPVQMVANTPYLLEMWVTIDPFPSGVQLGAQVDPTFTTSAKGGHFIFSPGVTGGAVPEPAVWTMMLAGIAALGGRLRRKTALERA